MGGHRAGGGVDHLGPVCVRLLGQTREQLLAPAGQNEMLPEQRAGVLL